MRAVRLAPIALVLLASCAAASGSHPWEWAGVFNLKGEQAYTWIASATTKGGGGGGHEGHNHGRMLGATNTWHESAYGGAGDKSMKMLIIKADTIAAAESTAMNYDWDYAGSATNVTGGAGVSRELGANTLYNLEFNVEVFMTTWKIHMETSGNYVIFCEHMPTEFEVDFHYLKDASGEDIEPTAQEPVPAAAAAEPALDCSIKPDGAEWAGVFNLKGHETYTWIASAGEAPAEEGGSHDGHNHGRVLAEDAHAGHDHGGPKAAYGPAGDTSMKLLIIKKDNATMMANTAALWAGTATPMDGGAGVPRELVAGTLYQLNFDTEVFMTTWSIHLADVGAFDYVIICEHVPTEFEVDFHYLKDAQGVDIEPEGGECAPDAGNAKTHSLGTAFGAAFLTAACSFFGLIMLIPVVSKYLKPSYAFAFASGVLLACAFMLMWPESLHLIPVNMDNPKEAQVSAVFAVMALLGFVTEPTMRWALINVLGLKLENENSSPNPPAAVVVTPVEKADADGPSLESGDAAAAAPAPTSAERKIDWSLALGISFGDGMHNIVDGVMIGIAFKLCDTTTAWSVASGAIGHELSQELGDFLVYTQGAGLSTMAALGMNFLASITCIIATIVAHSSDVDDTTMGCLLSYGAGTYMFIATVSCFSRIPSGDSAMHCGLFILGATALGLILLDHEHCSAGGAHAGHNH